MEDKTMEQIHNDIIKRYHTLCGKLGLTQDEKHEMLGAYGVESSRDMDTHDLLDLCAKLSKDLNKRQHTDEKDKLRKRVMAAVGGYLKANGKPCNASIIKAIACRATRHNDFNKIPRERLRNLVYLFNDKLADKQEVESIVSGRLVPFVRFNS